MNESRLPISEDDPMAEDFGAFLQRVRRCAEDWRTSDEFLGIIVRTRWPARYDLDPDRRRTTIEEELGEEALGA